MIAAVVELVVRQGIAHLVQPTPDWLVYTSAFSLYFVGVLATLVIGARCIAGFTSGSLGDTIISGAIAITSLLVAVPLLVSVDLVVPTEIAFGVLVIALVASTFGRQRDLGAQVGIVLFAIPLLVHVAYALGNHLIWPDEVFAGDRDMTMAKRLLGATGPEITLLQIGMVTVCVAALTSPYCFAPRPFAKAVTRPIPVVIAMATAAIGAIFARSWYPSVAELARGAMGIELDIVRPDRWLAIYLLAVATLVWTIISCVLAHSQARRTIGLGLGFVVLAGYSFQAPHHYLLPILGLALVSDATRRVRDEELAALPVVCETPPISDTTWATYVGAIVSGLRRSFTTVHSLTTRGDASLQSTIIIAEQAGDDPNDRGTLTARTRIERLDGCVLSFDVVVGRDIDELRGATLTLHAVPPPRTGSNPAAPSASPAFKSGDAPFDDHFRIRGNEAAFRALFDEPLRTRAVTSLDGWLAYWDGEGLRYRLYPGRGAPVDHPMPLSDLSLDRAMTNADRVVSVVELLVAVASRGVKLAPPDEPMTLDPIEPAAS